MAKLLLILVAGLLCEAVGVVFLNQGLRQVGDLQQISAAEIFRVLKSGVTNQHVLLGVFFEALFFGTLLVLMSKGGDVSFIWPLTALGFVFTTLAAKFILGEHVSWLRWSGVLLIMLGAAVITYTEKYKDKPPGATPTAHARPG